MKLRVIALSALSLLFAACGGGQHSFAPLDGADGSADRSAMGDTADAPAQPQDAAEVDASADAAAPGLDAGLDAAAPNTDAAGPGADASLDAAAPTDSSADGSPEDSSVG